MAYGQIRTSSGRVLNLSPEGWINNEGENLNDAPLNPLARAALGQQQPTSQPQQQGQVAQVNALMQQLQPQVELDVSRPVEVFGKGKGFFGKNDPLTVYDAQGNKIADLGTDMEATAKRQDAEIDRLRKFSQAQLESLKARSAEKLAANAMDMLSGAGQNSALLRDAARKLGVADAIPVDIDHQSVNSSRIPSGYRMTQDGNLEAIPGGPADLKLQGAFNQDTAALSGSTNAMDRLSTAANEAMNHPGLGGITGISSMFPSIPGGEAADAQAKLNTLKSQVAFGVLQDMRNNSKTGGALGSVSDAEGKRLEANLAALENAQSEKQMKESLQKIIEYTQGAKERLQSAYNLRHGGKTQQAQSEAAPAVGGAYSDPAKEARYQQWLKSQGR